MTQLTRLALACGVSVLTLGAAAATAQEWQPDRPINIIVPWEPAAPPTR